MNYRKYITITILIFGNLLVFSQSLNNVNDELGNFVNETIEIQSPVFEALESEIYDEFIDDLYKVITTKSTLDNSSYKMIYNKSAVNVLFKSDNTPIRFDSESIKTLNEALNTE